MTTARVETLPANWDDARDIPFFVLTAHVFPPEFCFGGSVLLASYDDGGLDTAGTAPAAERRTREAPAGLEGPASPDRDRVPVQVRRTP